jgi:hypothetical protein
MKLTTRPGNRPSFRRRRSTQQPKQVSLIPAQTSADELSELYTWAVNAAVENDRPELAYELALSFAREA